MEKQQEDNHYMSEILTSIVTYILNHENYLFIKDMCGIHDIIIIIKC